VWERLKTVRGQGRAAVRIALSLSFVALAALALASCGGGDDGGSEANLTGSGYPNGDLANTRQVAGQINSRSVNGLEEAWSMPIQGESAFGSYASSPVMSKGVVYSQDLESNVQAIDQESGDVIWSKSYESPDHGPNGVVVADGMVFGATATGAFALDQKTGKQKWSVTLTKIPQEGVDMAPGYYKGLVYVSTVPVNVSEFYGAGAVGTLYALDAKTGKKAWHFDTVPKDLWGHKELNSGGGLWYPPAFDDKGFMYFGVGNAGPFPGNAKFPWGSSRPGPNLYTNAIVKMNAKTGKMEWYWQQLPHAIYDWDFQGPPILLEAGGKEIVLAAGKSGVVAALDAKSGKPIWQATVGKHNGHDDDNLYAMRGEYEKLKLPSTVYPGSLGGVIAPMSTDGKTVFVPVNNAPMVITSQEQRSEPGPVSSEVVALDVATGKLKWKREFASDFAFGFTTVVNDLVFVTTSSGQVQALETSSGSPVWQAKLPAGTNAGVMAEGNTLLAPAGLPSQEGQSPQLVAYRLGDG
jgi:outer membrane protein assembly factor BamB